MSDTAVLHGTIVSAPALGRLEVTEGGYLVVIEGRIAGIFRVLPDEYAALPRWDYGSALILQGLVDLHLHAPQYPMLGTGMDKPLLEWLNAYAFPTEARFADPDYARTVYRDLAHKLIRGGTTRVCMFSSLHREATLILMEELERAGVTGYVGKVNMDRGSPDYLSETTEASEAETLRWLDEAQRFTRVRPILTPRFTPSCTNALMAFLGSLGEERALPIQSHLSENRQELELVASLHPDCDHYYKTYEKYGLFNERTVMAHCVWSDEEEREAMRKRGVTVVHCPDSNQNVCSGVAPVRKMLSEGLKVALGTDIAGGDSLSMFTAAASAVRASKARRILDDWQTEPLNESEAWYLATSAGAAFFGAKPGFQVGEKLHAIVLADDALFTPHPLSASERLGRALYLRLEGAIRSVWSEGRMIF